VTGLNPPRTFDAQRALRLAAATFDIEARALLSLAARQGEGFTRSVRAMLECRGRVIVMGMGKSGHVGRKVAAELKSKSASRSKSLGMQITAHRLELINNVSKKATIVEVTDLFDNVGMPCGTTVLLKIPV
jgi:hypothetical protein